MILTDYYHAEKTPEKKCRFEITASTGGYDLFESLLINKRGSNKGGHSINLVQRPDRWKGKTTDYALTKGSVNITSIKRPDPLQNVGFGDVKGTNDGLLLVFNSDFRETEIKEIEIFVARGMKHDRNSLYQLYNDGELNHEIENLQNKAVTKTVT